MKPTLNFFGKRTCSAKYIITFNTEKIWLFAKQIVAISWTVPAVQIAVMWHRLFVMFMSNNYYWTSKIVTLYRWKSWQKYLPWYVWLIPCSQSLFNITVWFSVVLCIFIFIFFAFINCQPEKSIFQISILGLVMDLSGSRDVTQTQITIFSSS